MVKILIFFFDILNVRLSKFVFLFCFFFTFLSLQEGSSHQAHVHQGDLDTRCHRKGIIITSIKIFYNQNNTNSLNFIKSINSYRGWWLWHCDRFLLFWLVLFIVICSCTGMICRIQLNSPQTLVPGFVEARKAR